MSVATRSPARVHRAWWVALGVLGALVAAAGFRSSTGALLEPIEAEFGWDRTTTSGAVGFNLLVYGLTAPFAAALMERYGLRRVLTAALLLVSLGSGLTVLIREPWQLWLLWGLLVGVGTGAMALVVGSIVANRWFVTRRGLVTGFFSAASSTGQLIFLPAFAALAVGPGWRYAAAITAAAALALVPVALFVVADRPEDVGTTPYGAQETDADAKPDDLSRCDSGPEPVAVSHRSPGWRPPSAEPGGGGTGRHGRDPPAYRATAPAYRRAGAARGEVVAGVLGARRDVLRVRLVHQRPGGHALHPRGARPRHGDDDGRRAARPHRRLRHRRDHRLRLAHRPGGPAAAAGHLLRAARAVAAGRPVVLGPEVHPNLFLFIVFYGLDWVATVPPTMALCRHYFRLERSSIVFGWVFASHMVGAGIAASYAGWVRQSSGDYFTAWLTAGILCLVAGVACLRLTTRPSSGQRMSL